MPQAFSFKNPRFPAGTSPNRVAHGPHGTAMVCHAALSHTKLTKVTAKPITLKKKKRGGENDNTNEKDMLPTFV